MKPELPAYCLDRRHLVEIGYIYCCRNGNDRPPMNEVVAMAKRYWALLLLKRRPTVDPSKKYEPEFEERIAAKIAGFPPEVKWNRYLRAIGLEDLPHGKPGPKPGVSRYRFRVVRRPRRKG